MENRILNKLSFHISPSIDSDDHQVRILIDGNDYLGKYLGIDPPQFFDQKNLTHQGTLLIGRCDCGFNGCNDTFVDVSIHQNNIIWTTEDNISFHFDRITYLDYIYGKKNDFSWEDLYRRVERLVTNELKNTTLHSDYFFDWATSRIENNKILLSYSQRASQHNRQQEIVEIHWNGTDLQDALNKAKEFKAQHKALEQAKTKNIILSKVKRRLFEIVSFPC